jgi:pilus assembly protein Flp/PilA
MSTIISAIKTFIADEDGVTAIEYGLIAALIGVAVAASAELVGDDIRAAFEFIAEQLPDSYTA